MKILNKRNAFIASFLIGFLIVHPLAMVVGHIMHEIDEPGSHISMNQILLEIVQTYSLEMLPWGIVFGILCGFAGYAYVSLKLQKELLQKANASKDKFFSIIAHDLRNPFSSLLNLSDTLLRRFDTLPDDKKKKLISSLQSSSQKTYKLLENLLEWSRMQSGDIQPNPRIIEINDLIRETIHLVKEKANSKSISIKENLQEGTFIFADRNMISLVLRNLAENAIKFTNKGGEITIRSARKDRNLEIIVEDNGIGMNEADMGRLFRVDMKQSRPGTEKESGTGLGLILCKEFIEKNKGQLKVSSQQNIGSRFMILLPASKTQSQNTD